MSLKSFFRVTSKSDAERRVMTVCVAGIVLNNVALLLIENSSTIRSLWVTFSNLIQGILLP